MFAVKKDRLQRDNVSVTFQPTPNVGGNLKPRFLIMHFTAGRSFNSSVTWLTNPIAKASAHLVIGRAGEVAQLADFDQVCWHAGKSTWQGLSGLNAYSIGIELDNAGKLSRRADGQWEAWFGGIYPDSEVIVAEHKHGGGQSGWHAFPQVQIEVALEIALALHAAYEFEDVLGHEDIAKFRKVDPGPAFPLISFASRVLGRMD